MARRSPFEIDLTRSERHDLERVARRLTAPYREVIRARIILLSAEGRSNTEIATKLGISRSTVITWRDRFANGDQSSRRNRLADLPRPGQPPKYSWTNPRSWIAAPNRSRATLEKTMTGDVM